MKRVHLFTLLICCLTFPCALPGQVVNSTICTILANPQAFNGKLVRIKGVVVAGFDEFAVKGQSCNQAVNAIWLAYPHGTNGKAGPAAILRLQPAKNSPISVAEVSRTSITLDKNSAFENFDKSLSTPPKNHGICLGCVKYSVTAVLVGRLDAAKSSGLIRDSQGTVIGLSGFGNLNRYIARLVLQSVSEVSSEKTEDTGKATAESGNAQTLKQSFRPPPPTADQVKRAIAAFGAPGEDNGVVVTLGSANEVPQNDTAESGANSPDGTIFHVTFDSKRLKGAAMQIALSHMGTHIADIRSKDSGIRELSLYDAEFRAWQTSVLMAAGLGVKSVMLTDTCTIFSNSWPNSELGRNADAGIAGYLATWSGIADSLGR